LNLLPFTLSPAKRGEGFTLSAASLPNRFPDPSSAPHSQGKPAVWQKFPDLPVRAANANFLLRLQPLISFSLCRAACAEPQHSFQSSSTGRRFAVNVGPTPQLCRFTLSATSLAIPTYSEPSLH